jgi:hypothetical protein
MIYDFADETAADTLEGVGASAGKEVVHSGDVTNNLNFV